MNTPRLQDNQDWKDLTEILEFADKSWESFAKNSVPNKYEWLALKVIQCCFRRPEQSQLDGDKITWIIMDGRQKGKTAGEVSDEIVRQFSQSKPEQVTDDDFCDDCRRYHKGECECEMDGTPLESKPSRQLSVHDIWVAIRVLKSGGKEVNGGAMKKNQKTLTTDFISDLEFLIILHKESNKKSIIKTIEELIDKWRK